MIKSQLRGEIFIPPSKSQTLRAIVFAAMADGVSFIYHPLLSPDTDAMLQACQLFGVQIEYQFEKLKIQGLARPLLGAEDVIHAGNSGIVLRFCAAIAALCERPVVITGDHSIRYQRPMKPLLNALSQLGVSAVSMRRDGYAPVIIQGPLKPGKAVLDGEDSQPVSALLIGAAFAMGPTEIEVINPGEKPWLALTLSWFDRLKISYTRTNYDYFHLNGHASYPGFIYHVPGDWSSASFPIAAAIVTGSNLVIKNVDSQDIQGDKELIDVFRQMGASIEWVDGHLAVSVNVEKPLQGVSVDINCFVDAVSILAVVACFAMSETCIRNAAIARKKECDRLACTVSELKKMGADIKETADGLIIYPSLLKGANVYSHEDHRLAMSLIVAGMAADGETIIDSVECISKTYPGFFSAFKSIGAKISL